MFQIYLLMCSWQRKLRVGTSRTINKRPTHRYSGKPFRLIQRKEAFRFRKYKKGLDFFLHKLPFFPFRMKSCCSNSLNWKTSLLLFCTWNSRGDIMFIFCLFWLRIRHFLTWHFISYLDVSAQKCHVTSCPADPEMSRHVHILHPCSPHKNEVQGRAKFLPK